MTNKEIVEKAKELITTPKLVVKDVTSINYKPHPYCITPNHITGESIYLNDEVIRRLEKKKGPMCGMYTDSYTAMNATQYANHKQGNCIHKCDIPYDEHTSDKVLAIIFKEKPTVETNEEFNKYLKPIIEALDGEIDGILPIKGWEDKNIES